MAENLLNIYNMAEHGVNTTLDPVHLNDGDLVKAQNAQVDSSGAYGVVRKRDGMAQFTQGALAGQVTGLIGLPLPDLSNLGTHWLLATNDQATWNGAVSTNNFITSTNGTSWAYTTTAGAKPAQAVRYGTWGLGPYAPWAVTWAVLAQKLYYPGNDYVSYNDQNNGGTTPTGFSIHRWDGTADYLIARIPDNPNRLDVSGGGIVALVPYSQDELIITVDDGNGAAGQGRVFLFSVTSGQLTQLARESNWVGGVPSVPFLYQGKIWCGGFVSNGTATDMKYTRPGDATWTVDTTFAGGRSTVNMVEFNGDLYVATASSHTVGGDQKGIIKKRTTLGVWSDVFTGDGGYDNITGPIIRTRPGVGVDTMLAAYSSDGTAPKNRILASTDGASWTTDVDMSTLLGGSDTDKTWSTPGYPAIDLAGNIYWPWYNSSSQVKIAKRTILGAWSVVENNSRAARGSINIIMY